LGIPFPVIGSIQVSRLPNDQASLRKVVEWWFQNTPNPEWSTIHQILGGNVCHYLEIMGGGANNYIFVDCI
jgi:hypothetical protein